MLGFGDPLDKETRAQITDLAAEFNNLVEADAKRLERYRSYRKELEEGREFLRLPLTNENGGDYGLQRKDQVDGRENIPLPFGQAITVKHTHRIAGRLPQPIVDRRRESAQERYRSDTMEKMWWGMLRESGETMLFADGAWDASSLGSACFETYLDQNNIPILRNVDPSGIVVVRGNRNPHDFHRVYRFWSVPVATLKNDYKGKHFGSVEIPIGDIDSTHKVGTIPMATVVQCAMPNKTIRFALGGKNGSKADAAVPLAEWEHNLGFVNYVVIPNVGPYRDVWGWADYEFIRGLVHYIPQLLSREADIIKAVANGAMIDKGTGEDPEVIRSILKVGGIVSSRKDGSLEPIQVPDIPGFAVDHSEKVMELLKMLSFTPDAAWGTMGSTSGSDRTLQLQPMLELTQLKQANWSAGLARLASFAFQIAEKQQGASAVYRGARQTRSGGSQAFGAFSIGPSEPPETVTVQSADPDQETEEIKLPRSPKELFEGDYSVRFIWQNRIDPDDPAYVTNELNKFQQGAQSLRRTLENLGVENPEDEIILIEEEANKHPWMRNGMIALMKMELDAAQAQQEQAQQNPGAGAGGGQSFQGMGGGAPFDAGQGLLRAAKMMGGKDGQALDADALRGALPGGLNEPYGGA